MYPVPGTIYLEPQITVEDAALKMTNVFTYLGSKIANDGQLDAEINCRIVKASASFGKLHSRVWSSHDLKLNTKVEVYNIVVLSTLLRRGLFTSDTARSSKPSTNDACVPYVASNGKIWSQVLKYFREAKLSRLKPTSVIVNCDGVVTLQGCRTKDSQSSCSTESSKQGRDPKEDSVRDTRTKSECPSRSSVYRT